MARLGDFGVVVAAEQKLRTPSAWSAAKYRLRLRGQSADPPVNSRRCRQRRSGPRSRPHPLIRIVAFLIHVVARSRIGAIRIVRSCVGSVQPEEGEHSQDDDD
jgi:hypothetical protein